EGDCHVELTINIYVINARLNQEGPGRFIGLRNGPRAMIEACALLIESAEGADHEPFCATRIEKRVRFRKAIRQESRRPAEQVSKISPVIAILPVAFHSVFKVILIIPVALYRQSRG